MAIQKFTAEQALEVNSLHTAFIKSEAALAEIAGNQMMGNAGASLPRDFFAQWATDGIEVQRDTLQVFSALQPISRGIDIGLYADYFMTVSDSGEVNVSVDGQSQAKGDQATFKYHGVPLAMFDSTASFGWKQMKAAMNKGFSLQLPTLRNNQRKVAEKQEAMVLDGLTDNNGDLIDFDGAKAFGLRNAPRLNAGTFTTAIKMMTGAEAKDLGVAIMEKQHGAKFFTPVKVFMNYEDWYHLKVTNYSEGANFAKSALEGLMMALPMGSEVIPSASLDTDEVIAICPRRDVYEILNGMPMTTIPTVRNSQFDPYEFRVMASQTLQLKFDDNGNAGYTRLTKAGAGKKVVK